MARCGECGICEVAFHSHELVSVFVSCRGQGWFFKPCFCGSPVPPALCYWWLGKSALECAGDCTYGAGDPFIQSLGFFFFFLAQWEKNQNESFQEVWLTLGIRLFQKLAVRLPRVLDSLGSWEQKERGGVKGIFKIISLFIFSPLSSLNIWPSVTALMGYSIWLGVGRRKEGVG